VPCFPSGCGFFALEHLHRLARHDCRDGVLVYELGMPVTPQEDTKIVERRDNARQFHTIDKKYRQRYLLLADSVEKKVLQVLRTFRHSAASFLFAGST
jgi:hypothetical protein